MSLMLNFKVFFPFFICFFSLDSESFKQGLFLSLYLFNSITNIWHKALYIVAFQMITSMKNRPPPPFLNMHTSLYQIHISFLREYASTLQFTDTQDKYSSRRHVQNMTETVLLKKTCYYPKIVVPHK